MTIASYPRWLRLAAVPLCLVLVVVAGTPVAVWSAPAATLRIDPATIVVSSGETHTLALWVEDVEGLRRAELHLTYDQDGLEVQDDDPGRAGVQIEPGAIFEGTCDVWNEAADGEIHFVAQREPDDDAFSGSGIVATITFLVAATDPATYTLSFDQATSVLLDDDGEPISVGEFGDATITLPPPLVTLTGWLTREGWGDEDRSVANAVLYSAASPYEVISWGRTCTDVAGNYALEIGDNSQSPPVEILPSGNPPGSAACTSRWAFVRLDFTNFLSECYWECADGQARDIGWHTLEGGDVNADGCVNILDIVDIIGDFGQSVGTPCYIVCAECPAAATSARVAPSSDLNGDCSVNILDLTQAAGNFGLCSNCP